ncbi:transcriptional regulator PpsR [Ruegeria profundi]|uniref:transcriptional regulator PpsR n=1 Tax=Ruegeria profundi TaxID=1685378 RepID=UPI001CD4F213|nr:transcriptional regulator PpsR [Ruegeria profundi]MCA0928524.1 transcriptional regulator PpsR [Ruegeria profundi]
MTSGKPNPWQIAALPMIEPEFLSGVLSEASDIALIVDPEGVVKAALVNETGSPYGSLDHWIGKKLTNFLTEECIPKLDRILERSSRDEKVQRVELNHRDKVVWQYPVRYSIHPVGHSERAILMLGRDLRQVAETQQQLVQAQFALEQGYEERREYDARYRMLMSVAREAFVLVSVADGRIRDLNDAAAHILGAAKDQLQGQPFANEFKDRGRAEFVQNILALALSEVDAEVTIQTKRTRNEVTITPISFRAGGARMLICRLEAGTSEEHASDKLSDNLVRLFRHGPEAIVFTDSNGVVQSANDAFMRLVDFAHHVDVRGTSLAEYMSRGQIDLNVMLDNAIKTGRMSAYSTKFCNDVGVWTAAEVSVSYLNKRSTPTVAFVIRDATRSEAMRTPAQGSSNMAGEDVVDLVGSAHLKDIVSQTTDVIERICIETAIELTGNNRAAAAEMLGLSRQSLYVKLHKLGIQEKQDGH